MTRPAIAALLLFAACAHDEGVTAHAHRTEAARHTELAQREQDAAAHGGARQILEKTLAGLDYDPSAAHLAAADLEFQRAAEHLAAAKSLDRFEDQACTAIPAAERAACPLLASSVTHVRETPEGVTLMLKPHVDGADTNRRLNCHLAFARAQGFAKSCPLFVAGMTIRLQSPQVIVLAGEGAVAGELQRQARRIFGAPVPVSLAP